MIILTDNKVSILSTFSSLLGMKMKMYILYTQDIQDMS